MSSLDLRVPESTAAPLGRGLRLLAGTLILGLSIVLELGALRQGSISIVPFALAVGAVALIVGRFGRMAHYLLPTMLAFGAYVAARQYVAEFKLGVHYLPQLRADELLAPGPIRPSGSRSISTTGARGRSKSLRCWSTRRISFCRCSSGAR